MSEIPGSLPPKASYQDVLDAPEHHIAQLIRGKLHTQARPAARHARVLSSLGVKVGGPFDLDVEGPEGWWILDEPELHLDKNVLVPDLAGWRRSRMPSIPDVPFFETKPCWVCEVLSPSSRRIDRVDKREIYAAAGVTWLWLIDPDARELEAYTLQNGRWLQIAHLCRNAPVSVEPFHAISFPLTSLWID